jgi:WD40 repeat protein
VAVSRGPKSRIVSGSDEGIVRIWERAGDEERWEEVSRLDHNIQAGRSDPIRALACTPAKGGKNLLMTATSTGRLRLFDLDDLKAGQMPLSERHQGAVNAIAFNAEGTIAATGGEDRSISLWNVANQTRILRKSGAHQNAITSLAFTPSGQLVSAGRDKGLVVWNVERGNGNEQVLTEVDRLPGRSGEVNHLGLDPTGESTLFDEGRELRVISLAKRRIEGSLSNSGASGSFSTLALFSPSGKTVLTNGSAAGRLQLWRAPSAKTRAAELRQFLWNYPVTCGAFDPSGDYAVTGTSDHKVLVWKMPSVEEATNQVRGELSYVEGFLDTTLKRVTVRATLDNPKGWLIPGSAASIVIPGVTAK